MPINIADEINQVIGTIIAWIPRILSALVILLIGYLIARAIAAGITALLKRTNFNEKMSGAPYGNAVRRVSRDPAKLIGSFIYWLAFFFVITLAVLALNVPVLNQVVFAIYAYIPNVIVALLILLGAIALAAGVNALVSRLMDGTLTGRIIGAIAPALILTIAVFMILVQLQIATSIVLITYIALVGSLAVAFALAFGLGGRDVAGRLMEQAYKKGEESAEQVKQDIQTAQERSREEARRLKEKYV